MNKAGYLLEKIRLENDETLYDMASRLGVTQSFLSAVENGRKAAPYAWYEVIASEYELDADSAREIELAFCDTAKQVRIGLDNLNKVQKQCAFAFAKKLNQLNDKEIQDIMALLKPN